MIRAFAWETANNDLLIERIARETGFNVEMISGDEEARLIHLAVTHALNFKRKRALLIDLVPEAMGPSLSRQDQARASAERMERKYAYDAEHAVFTAQTAVNLFNQSLSLYHLAENERLLLEIAARLHDTGHFINTLDHDRQGNSHHG